MPSGGVVLAGPFCAHEERESQMQEEVSTPTHWVRVTTLANILGIKPNRVYALLKNTKEIKACTLKTRSGAGRGAIFIHVPSLLAYMEKLAAERMVGVNE
jgi:hypothetical protein